MTLRNVVSACCGMIFVLHAPRSGIQWGVRHRSTTKNRDREAEQKRGLVPMHSGGGALKEIGAISKHELRPQTPDTPVAQLHKAISALRRSAPFIHQLSDYAARDRGRRITNVNDWTRRSIDLPSNLADYAQCLVDIVSSGVGSSSPATPR